MNSPAYACVGISALMACRDEVDDQHHLFEPALAMQGGPFLSGPKFDSRGIFRRGCNNTTGRSLSGGPLTTIGLDYFCIKNVIFEQRRKHHHNSCSKSSHGDCDWTIRHKDFFSSKSTFNKTWTAICPARPGCICYRDDAGGPVQSFLKYRARVRNIMKAICPARPGYSCVRSDAGGHYHLFHNRCMSRNKMWAICTALPGRSCVWSDAGGKIHSFHNHSMSRNKMWAICPARLGCSCVRTDAGGQTFFFPKSQHEQ